MRLGPYLLGPNDDNQGIYTGDMRHLGEAIPDSSVDLILCDPPYLRETMHCYSDLAVLAARVLKPGGYCAAYCGTEFLPQAIARLGEHLDWFWQFTLRHNGCYPLMAYKRVMVAYKPVLVFSKGRPSRVEYLVDGYDGDIPDKRHHRWGQGEKMPFLLIHKWTDEGAVILDPFCGGGTVPAVCKMLRRRWLAFEVDAMVAQAARERVRTTQPPLFVPTAEQIALEIS